MSISFATLNLKNLQVPGGALYQGAVMPQARHDAKVAWTAQLLADADADVVGFQELWDNQALTNVFNQLPLAGNYQLRFGDKNRGIGCALAVRNGFEIVHSTSFGQLPEEAARLRDADGEIDVALATFSRPVLRATIRPPQQGARQPLPISVFVAHLKSKRPTQNPVQPDNVAFRNSDRQSIGSTISLVRRATEAAGLRVLVSDVMAQDINRPNVVLGDLNDSQRSVPIYVITTKPPYRLAFASRTGFQSRWGLYAVAELQELKSLRDVYYTHIYQGLRESLDHILVSTHFYDYSDRRAWSFDQARIWNDHLEDEDSDDSVSDHGLLRAEFAWRPASAHAHE